jgi:type IV secretory pathway VirB10-like protein
MDADLFLLSSSHSHPKGHPAKHSSLPHIENLLSRGSATSAKINSLKLKQKAKELKDLQLIPKIDNNSKRIAEGLIKERLNILAEYESKHQILEAVNPVIPEPVQVSVSLAKVAESPEESAPKQEIKIVSMHERNRQWQEQKKKKLDEQRKAKEEKALDGCTFKPRKAESQDFRIVEDKKYEKKDGKEKAEENQRANAKGKNFEKKENKHVEVLNKHEGANRKIARGYLTESTKNKGHK